MDYKELYFTLFNKVTDVIIELQEIQQETEARYVNAQTDCSEDD